MKVEEEGNIVERQIMQEVVRVNGKNFQNLIYCVMHKDRYEFKSILAISGFRSIIVCFI